MKSGFKFLWLFPPIFIFIFIWHFGVDMPLRDQFDTPGKAIIEFSKGTLSFNDLIAQHNESRKFFPRLTFIALSQLTGWNTRYEMFLSWIISCGIYWNVLQLAKHTLGKGRPIFKALGILVIGLFIFSPAQYQNWLWGIQPITFVPAWALTSCIAVFYSQMSLGLIFLTCSVVCTIATFSYANGILTWVLVIPIIVISGKWRLFPWSRRRILFLFGWLGMALLSALLYFHDYAKPGHHPSFLYAITHPIKSAIYFLSFLGLPLSGGLGVIGSAMIGAVSILLFIFFCVRVFSTSKDRFLYKALGWLTLAAYTLLSALITTSGRVGFGVEQSLAGRYVTFVIPLYVAICGLFCVWISYAGKPFQFKELTLSEKPQKKGFLSSKSISFVVCLFVFLSMYWHSSAHALDMAYITKLNASYGKTCLMFLAELPDKDCIEKYVYPNIDTVRQRIPIFKAAAKLSLPILESKFLQDLKYYGDKTKVLDGSISQFKPGSDTQYVANGRVSRSSNGFMTDSILLAYEDDISGKDTVFKIVGPLRPTEHLMIKVDNVNERNYLAWQVAIPKSLLPESACIVSAWAFDTDTVSTKKIESELNICN
ncbi:MAG: hypothetical protein AAF579_09510 [Cyanobacteria bacterium P01_C01_bin.118]